VLPVSEGARLSARDVRLGGAIDLAGVALPARAADLLGIGIEKLSRRSIPDSHDFCERQVSYNPKGPSV
jgi:hypothetical protein